MTRPSARLIPRRPIRITSSSSPPPTGGPPPAAGNPQADPHAVLHESPHGCNPVFSPQAVSHDDPQAFRQMSVDVDSPQAVDTHADPHALPQIIYAGPHGSPTVPAPATATPLTRRILASTFPATVKARLSVFALIAATFVALSTV